VTRLALKNLSDRPKAVTFRVVEFCLERDDDLTNIQRNSTLARWRWSGRVYHKTNTRERRNHLAVGRSPRNRRLRHDREAFFGLYNVLERPARC
jgi:hypothetical protein